MPNDNLLCHNIYTWVMRIISCLNLHGLYPNRAFMYVQSAALFFVLLIGPWMSKLLIPLGLELPLTVGRIPVYYWQVDQPELYTVGNDDCKMGVFSHSLDKSISCFGLPSFEHPGLIKVEIVIINLV